MLREFILGVTLLTATPAATETFYKGTSDRWEIEGNKNRDNLNDSCIVQQHWNERTFFRLIQDLIDGELYLIITNPSWQITNPPGSTAILELTFKSQQGSKKTSAQYELLSPNTITIRAIKEGDFIPNFMSSQEIFFQMPGNIPNLTIPLSGSRNSVGKLVECFKTYEGKPGAKL